MNSITNLLDLEDTDIEITDIQIQGQTKTLTLSTPPVPHFCPSCGFRMYSRGIKKRTINHPILQDNYSLVLILKQRRWRCTNPECLYDTSESFKFVNRQRRTTNATDMLIVDAYRNLLETSVSIAKKFHVSDSHAHDIFNRYVKLDRLTLTDAISIDEVFLDMDEHCKYALVIIKLFIQFSVPYYQEPCFSENIFASCANCSNVRASPLIVRGNPQARIAFSIVSLSNESSCEFFNPLTSVFLL